MSTTENQAFEYQSVATTFVPQQVKVSQIQVDAERFSLRDAGDYEYSEIKELVEDIALHGLLVPLLLQKLDGDKFLTIDGHRRFAAIEKLIRDGVEGFSDDMLVSGNVIVSEADELTLLTCAAASNVQRRSLTAEGRCRFTNRAHQHGMPVKQISFVLGVGESTVMRDLALGSDADMLQHVAEKNITATNAATLIKAAQDAGRVDVFKRWFGDWVASTLAAIESEEMARLAQDEASLSPSDKWPQRYMPAALVRTLKDQLLKGEPLAEPGFKFKAILKDDDGRQKVEIDALSLDVAAASSEQLAKVFERLFDLAATLEPVVLQKHEAERRSRELGSESSSSRGRSRLLELGLTDLVEPSEESDD